MKENYTITSMCKNGENGEIPQTTQFDMKEFLKSDGKSKDFPKERDRYRMFHFSFYCEINRFSEIIQHADHYAYIRHDKDDSEPHYHLVVEYTEGKTLRSVMRRFIDTDFTEDTNIKVTIGRDRKALAHYLIHETADALKDGKHLYDKNELITDNNTWWFSTHYRSKDEPNQFVDDLLNCKLTHREMAYKYGRDYIRNAHHYKGFVQMVATEDRKIERKAYIQELQESLVNAADGDNVSVENLDTIVEEYIPCVLSHEIIKCMRTSKDVEVAIWSVLNKVKDRIYTILDEEGYIV